MTDACKSSSIMQILEKETSGKSYKTHKYSLDEMESSSVEYEHEDPSKQWERRGETDAKNR
ncbi:MAG: hypothetical protein FWG98_00775 [Candidatus Cloacimonetes bacterium]|nr:hypothetical protein [Candidatus Cloacimonadota bacterium]